jgi:peptide/nickel transport system permease protein
MVGFVLKRIAGYVATLATAVLISFLAFGAGTPAAAPDAGLGDRLLGWLGALTRGDPGQVLEALAISLPLLLLALTLAVLIALPLGAQTARPGGPAAAVIAALARLAGTAPSLVFALLLALIAGRAGFQPGFSALPDNLPLALAALALPAIAAALPVAAVLSIDVRDALREVRGADFIRTAQAHGLTLEQAMRRHGRRSVAVAVLGASGPRLALLVAAVYAAEKAFGLPGLSALVSAGLAHHDAVRVGAGMLALAAMIATALLLLDLLRALADPRIGLRIA